MEGLSEYCESTINGAHREIFNSLSRAFDLYFRDAYELLLGSWKWLEPHLTRTLQLLIAVWNNEITDYVKWLLGIIFIPFVASILDDRLEQVFLIVYTITKLSANSAKEEVGTVTGGLWGLLLPSLVLAGHILPDPTGGEPSKTKRWRILSITWHMLVIYMNINSDILDPSIESIIVGTMVLYIMSLDVWTGLSVLSLTLFVATCQNYSLIDLRSLRTEQVYALLFALEHYFLNYESKEGRNIEGKGKPQ